MNPASTRHASAIKEKDLPNSDAAPIELPGLLEHSIQVTSEQIEGKSVSTIAEFPAHLPAISAERQQLQAVLSCLLEQAALMTAGGEIKVRAELLTSEAEASFPASLLVADDLEAAGPWVLLTVSFISEDNQQAEMKALAESDVANLVEWFAAPCGQSIADYANRIWLAEAGAGWFQLNLALPIWAAYEVGSHVSSVRRAVRSRLGDQVGQGAKLLLMVEDDRLMAHLEEDLTSAGYQVIPVRSGEEVLALARQEQPELILLDLVARAPTAFEVAGILKHDRRTRNLPVQFLTSLDDSQDEVEMGTVGFLPRQADTGAIISAVNSILTSGISPLSRFLVVEQEERMRDHMVTTIQAQGYRVSEASGPEEAMALAERATPDVALVNASLAQERDYWLLRALRSTAREAEIYVLADVMDEAAAKAAMRRGASGFRETGQLPDLLDRMRRRQQGDDE